MWKLAMSSSHDKKNNLKLPENRVIANQHEGEAYKTILKSNCPPLVPFPELT